MKTVTKLIPLVLVASLVGCSNMSPTEQNVLGGAVIGTGVGAIVGGGRGAAIGAGVGALGGLLYDSSQRDGYYYDEGAYYNDGYYGDYY
jgi:uncharacterized protein YcfJ